MLAWNSSRIASRMPDLAVMMAMTLIISLFSSGDAFEDAVVAARRQWTDLCRPVAIASGLLPGRALQHVGRVELISRQVALHSGHRRVLEPIARRRADAGHLRQHWKMLGVVDAVELGLVLGRDVQLHDKDMGHRQAIL